MGRVQDHGAANPEDRAASAWRRERLITALNRLEMEEQQVLWLRFGLDGDEPWTLSDVGKVINDVFEFLLLGSGRIVLYPASEREPIVLENVLNVNKAENSIKKLLSALKVHVAPHGEMYPAEEH